MRSPQNLKEVQQLMGKVAALSRFIPRSAETALPIFGALKKGSSRGTSECEEAFKRLKATLSAPPILTRLTPGTPLHLYLSASEKAINTGTRRGTTASLFRKQGSARPRNSILKDGQNDTGFGDNFLKIKAIFPELRDNCKNRSAYSASLGKTRFGRPDEFDITFESRGKVRVQALADFLVEMTPALDKDEEGEWFLSVDGSSNHTGSGAGVILEGPTGAFIEQSLHFKFRASNNQVEYEALLAGIKHAKEMGARRLTVKSDSKLITGQVNGDYQAKDPQLAKYCERVASTASSFDKFTLLHVSREQNERADLLAKLASTQKRGQ
ncbi:rnhA, partial [Mucuna pruriens]